MKCTSTHQSTTTTAYQHRAFHTLADLQFLRCTDPAVLDAGNVIDVDIDGLEAVQLLDRGRELVGAATRIRAPDWGDRRTTRG